MDPNDAKAATNSSIEESEFSCRELYATFFTVGDVSDSIPLWIVIGLVSLASPTIVLLNALVIIALRRRKELPRLSNVLLFSIATADLLTGAVCIPLSVIVDSFVARQTLPENVCVLHLLTEILTYIFSWSSVLHLMLIAWERYVAIQKWMEYKRIVTKSRLNKLAIIAWVSATFMVLPDIILLTVVNEEDRLDFAEVWFIVNALLGVCALALIVYFYVMMYLGFRKRKLSEISQVTSLISAKLEKKSCQDDGHGDGCPDNFLPSNNSCGCVGRGFSSLSRKMGVQIGGESDAVQLDSESTNLLLWRSSL